MQTLKLLEKFLTYISLITKNILRHKSTKKKLPAVYATKGPVS